MPVDRYFFDGPLEAESNVCLSGPEFHHLSRVTRKRAGEAVELVNGKGVLATASIDSLSKTQASLSVIASCKEPPPPFTTILAQAIPLMNRLDFIIEKGTELGMAEIWLFPGSRSEKTSLTEHQVNRLSHIAVAAMKQSGRLYLPKIKILPGISTWDSLPSSAYFGDLSRDAPTLLQAWQQAPPKSSLLFLVGPEGGFTEQEIRTLKEKGASGVSLHGNILRTDTASLAALAIINHLAATYLPTRDPRPIPDRR